MKDMYSLKQIPSEAQIQKFLRRILFGKNVFCPKCRYRQVSKDHERYWCSRCRRRFSLLSYTWLHDLKIPLQLFWLILWCWTKAIPVKQAMELTKLSELAIRRWYSNFREHLPENPHVLERVVQLDEAYGKGWTLMMAKQKRTRRVAYLLFSEKSVQKHHAHQFLQQFIKPGSRVATDGSQIYRDMGSWWPAKHDKDIHSKWEFSKTSEIEGLFGNLRTFIRRMYHHVTAEKMPEYVREFCFRFSSPEMFQNPSNYLSKCLITAPID